MLLGARSVLRRQLAVRVPAPAALGQFRLLSTPSDKLLEGSTCLDILKMSKNKDDQLRHVRLDETVMHALRHLIEGGVGSLVVKDDKERVVGFLSQRDVLRSIAKARGGPWQGKYDEPKGWNVSVSTIMTPSKDLIYLSPEDTIADARALMSVSGKRHVPVISGSTLLGIISPKDIARLIHLAKPEVRARAGAGAPLGVLHLGCST